jgi:hypothetical protein
MKIRLLLLCLLFTATAFAQTDSIAHAKKDSLRLAKAMARKKHIDIGGGVQVNSFNGLGSSTGLLFSLKANSQTGRIAGLFNMSYNLNNHFGAISPVYSYNNYNQTFPRSKFESNVRYNLLKLSLAAQIPFFNRTNKKGFSLAAIVGASYYNGMGSGEYISFLDKSNPPTIDSSLLYMVRPSQEFDFDNNNLNMFSVDLGLSFNYTFERYQLFADFSTIFYSPRGDTFTRNSDVPWMAWFGGLSGSNFSYNLNIGLRYCLYYPWQAKPSK